MTLSSHLHDDSGIGKPIRDGGVARLPSTLGLNLRIWTDLRYDLKRQRREVSVLIAGVVRLYRSYGPASASDYPAPLASRSDIRGICFPHKKEVSRFEHQLR